jgi:DNA repair protein RecO (recombination protein O)
MVHGARKRKSNHPPALFQALQIVNVEMSYREKANLQTLKEINLVHQLTQLHTQIVKSSIALFLAELIQKTIREEEKNEGLFNFFYHFILQLDQAPMEQAANYHLWFMVQHSRFLGILPAANFDAAHQVFNMQSGEFEAEVPAPFRFQAELGILLQQLLISSLDELKDLKLSQSQRRKLLNGLVQYYQIHLPEMGELKSLDVLETVFA